MDEIIFLRTYCNCRNGKITCLRASITWKQEEIENNHIFLQFDNTMYYASSFIYVICFYI